ncbi:MAG TPA: aminodeoxychorismate/anthranilate synthase component II [Nocardioides sp.]|nr:aminodeoxychorismate/anthranilate synthase component II [Nocardioides sp.]
MNARRPTQRAVVVDHRDSYTWNLVHLVAAATGALPTVVQHDRTSLDEVLAHDLVVLSPGPGHPDDPADFAIGGAILRAAEVPVLGVCLGMQGMVTTYGGHVERIAPAHGEVAHVRHTGRGPLAGLPSPYAAVRYHSLAATVLPPELVATAWCTSTVGTEVVMAVQHRELPQYGVQFHPESVLSEHGLQLVRNFVDLALGAKAGDDGFADDGFADDGFGAGRRRWRPAPC